MHAPHRPHNDAMATNVIRVTVHDPATCSQMTMSMTAAAVDSALGPRMARQVADTLAADLAGEEVDIGAKGGPTEALHALVSMLELAPADAAGGVGPAVLRLQGVDPALTTFHSEEAVFASFARASRLRSAKARAAKASAGADTASGDGGGDGDAHHEGAGAGRGAQSQRATRRRLSDPDAAASAIQAVARGRQSRVKAAQLRLSSRRGLGSTLRDAQARDAAAVAVQRVYRGHATRAEGIEAAARRSHRQRSGTCMPRPPPAPFLRVRADEQCATLLCRG